MSQDDERARQERAARLHGRIDRMTGHGDDGAPRDVSDDATADAGESDSAGGSPDEGTVADARPHAHGDARTRASDDDAAAHKGESPREFIHRKMREGGQGEKG